MKTAFLLLASGYWLLATLCHAQTTTPARPWNAYPPGAMVLHLPFDGYGHRDASGAGNNVVASGTQNLASNGVRGIGLYLSGNANLTNNAASLNIGTNSFTILAWVKFTSASTMIVVEMGNGTSQFPTMYVSSGRACEDVHNSDADTCVTSPTINDGAWHAMAIVRNTPARTKQIWVDGVMRTNVAWTGGSAAWDALSRVSVGSRNASLFYTGMIDNPTIVSGVLPDSDIISFYTDTKPANP